MCDKDPTEEHKEGRGSQLPPPSKDPSEKTDEESWDDMMEHGK